MDYESLLRKYIAHVVECEGYDFINDVNGSHWGAVTFTPDEVKELERLSMQVDDPTVSRA